MGSEISVLHVLPTLGVGGLELATARVARGLLARGVCSHVLCLDGESRIDAELGQMPVHCLGGRRGVGPVAQVVRQVAPDVVHARNWGAWPDAALACLAEGRSRRLVFSFHGLDRPPPMPLRRRLAFRALAKVTAEVFTVSHASRRLLVEHVGLSAARVKVIPNGVDTLRFSPGPQRAEAGVIGTVGSLTAVKNHRLLIDVLARLRRQGLPVSLRIAGGGPLRGELERAARAAGVAELVEMPGPVDDVPGFLRGLDVFVLTSDSEQHPNALLEAMACGLPCVATDVGGVREVLGGGDYGALAAPGDAQALTDAVAHLLRDAARRRELALASRGRVQQAYSLAAMLDAYDTMYRRLARAQREG